MEYESPSSIIVHFSNIRTQKDIFEYDSSPMNHYTLMYSIEFSQQKEYEYNTVSYGVHVK